MNFSREKKNEALQIVVYGLGGVAKSTLATTLVQNCNPCIIDTDDSYTGDLAGKFDVNDDKIPTWNEYENEVDDLFQKMSSGEDTHGALIIDTITQVEILMTDLVKADKNWKDMSVEGFGQCWIPVQEKFNKFLDKLSRFKKIGVHVVIIAHANAIGFDQPEIVNPIQKWSPLLNKKNASSLISWSDATLYIFNSISAVNVDAGYGSQQAKAVQGQSNKKISTTDSPYSFAKNRHRLRPTYDYPLDDPLTEIVEKLGIEKVERKTLGTAPVSPVETTPVATTEPIQQPPVTSQEPVNQPANTPPPVQPAPTMEQTNAVNMVDNAPPPKSNMATFPIELYDRLKEADMSDEEFMIMIGESPNNEYTIFTRIDQYDQSYVDAIVQSHWVNIADAYKANKPAIKAKAEELKKQLTQNTGV